MWILASRPGPGAASGAVVAAAAVASAGAEYGTAAWDCLPLDHQGVIGVGLHTRLGDSTTAIQDKAPILIRRIGFMKDRQSIDA